MAGVIPWARVVVVGADGTRRVVLLAGEGPPDLAVVEGLARLQLMARRAGERMWLEEVSAALRELLDLAGLHREMREPADAPGGQAAVPGEQADPSGEQAGAPPGQAGAPPGQAGMPGGRAGRAGRCAGPGTLRREVGGQAEGGEEPLGVQEEVEGGDAVP
jgi:hypothetical protein